MADVVFVHDHGRPVLTVTEYMRMRGRAERRLVESQLCRWPHTNKERQLTQTDGFGG